ncbi:hypothetical protein [Lysinibacillus sphaericus]|uniref:Uncharacterized protein n=1 Tax=Lysinibacillus sphaericus OT4b.31 TaxID=1285586 RepID=R7ZIV3_LYSSH|nr:hypothetical protein [Lysinibacillus sphaericus]EON73969.1 hypothetical protein H131_04879 [Lysinibacillus sphaericus OT4b.31]
MNIDKGWRSSVQAELLRRAQEDNMKSVEVVKELVEAQFKDFAQPIEELTDIIADNDQIRYKAYDRALDVNYASDVITFYRVKFSSNGEQKERKFFAEISTNDDGIFVVYDNDREEYINEAYIERILKEAFFIGISLRV